MRMDRETTSAIEILQNELNPENWLRSSVSQKLQIISEAILDLDARFRTHNHKEESELFIEQFKQGINLIENNPTLKKAVEDAVSDVAKLEQPEEDKEDKALEETIENLPEGEKDDGET